jgi:hypothetical protein
MVHKPAEGSNNRATSRLIFVASKLVFENSLKINRNRAHFHNMTCLIPPLCVCLFPINVFVPSAVIPGIFRYCHITAKYFTYFFARSQNIDLPSQNMQTVRAYVFVRSVFPGCKIAQFCVEAVEKDSKCTPSFDPIPRILHRCLTTTIEVLMKESVQSLRIELKTSSDGGCGWREAYNCIV